MLDQFENKLATNDISDALTTYRTTCTGEIYFKKMFGQYGFFMNKQFQIEVSCS